MSPLFARLLRTPGHRLVQWLASWVALAMLAQAILPTLAFISSGTRSEPWAEICTVYGLKQPPVKADSGSAPASSRHADCPLCLQVFHDVILDTADAAPGIFVLAAIRLVLPLPIFCFTHRTAQLPEARAPPAFN